MASTSSTVCRNHEFFGPLIRDKLVYYPTVTREPFRNRGRITDLIASGQLFRRYRADRPRYRDRPHHAVRQPGDARGTPRDVSARGFVEGTTASPAISSIEKAFVER
jgi:ferredoxin--NADP+ reductase